MKQVGYHKHACVKSEQALARHRVLHSVAIPFLVLGIDIMGAWRVLVGVEA